MPNFYTLENIRKEREINMYMQNFNAKFQEKIADHNSTI